MEPWEKEIDVPAFFRAGLTGSIDFFGGREGRGASVFMELFG